MKRPLLIAGAAVLVAVIVFASIRGSGAKGEKVYVEPARARKLEAVVAAPGEIDPKVKVNISAHVIGKIEKLYFDEGDTVHKGQKLVDLEKYQIVSARDRAVADLANRRVEVTRAQAQVATAQAAYNRAMNLQKQGIQAQEAFETARLQFDNARAALGSAEQGVRESEAMLTQMQTDLSRTTIVSPIDGKVVQLNAHEGEVVVTGTMNNPGSVIAVIADLSEILVEAEVGETEVVGIRVGQPARIKVDAVADHEYRGHVEEIGSSAAIRQSGAGSGIRYFKVKVAIDDPDDRLRPGMTSQVSIVTSTVGNAIAVPIQSVVERVPGSKKAAEDEDEDAPKKKYVFVVRDGKAKMVEVATGISDATQVAIVSGLKAGDSVVTGPFRTLKKLHDGDFVIITKEEKTSTAEKSDK
ncbi:MAG TPA: efflux RND transporter periplasmic adaptor subunit [Thermoanaerobaculia bacterium]